MSLRSWCERSVRTSPCTSGPFAPDSARAALSRPPAPARMLVCAAPSLGRVVLMRCSPGTSSSCGLPPGSARVARSCRAAREWPVSVVLGMSGPFVPSDPARVARLCCAARVARWCRVGREWPVRAAPVLVRAVRSRLAEHERSIRARLGASGPFVLRCARVARWCRPGRERSIRAPLAANETPARRLSTASDPTGASAASPIRGPRRRRGGLRDRARFPVEPQKRCHTREMHERRSFGSPRKGE